MNAAPVQTDRRAWEGSRVGRFTASTIGALMSEPRSKAAREAGEWSETAKALISAKAVERITGKPIHTSANWSMKRGVLLEHAACHLLSKHWKPINACTWQPIGKTSGATPDGLLDDGTPVDIKCPEAENQLFEFADQVHDGEWGNLLAWDRNYAWQVAMQAMACGTDMASLIYFSDRIAKHRIGQEEADTCNAIMEAIGEKLFTLTGSMYDYRLSMADEKGYGFAYVARTFTFTPQVFEKIEAVVEAADQECENLVRRYAGSLK